MMKVNSECLDSSAIVHTIKEKGVAIVEDFLDPTECGKIRDSLEKILGEFVQNHLYFGSNINQVIYNYFLYDPYLMQILELQLIDEVMKKLIDDDYVLISPSARNPLVRAELPEGKKTSGFGWHTDSRVADKGSAKLYMPSMNFYAALAIEPFTKENAATKYIPNSHLAYQKPLDREAALLHETLEVSAGALIFYDAALWHRVGLPTKFSRWSIFNMYGPWFMKPYFNFLDNLTEAEIQGLSPLVRKILHGESLPPKNQNERVNTLSGNSTGEASLVTFPKSNSI